MRESQSSVKKSFTNTVICMQQKFPLTNNLLLSLSGLDPTAMGHLTAYNFLKRLSEYFLKILTDSVQEENYLQKISNIQLNENLRTTKSDGHYQCKWKFGGEKYSKFQKL